MIRCKTCLIPDTRPDTAFIDGECSACVSFRKRPNIDWAARKLELCDLLEKHRNSSGFDCIVPSSGGKDSHWQTLTLIELGAKPLVVTAATCYLTSVGRANIDNLSRYATTVEVTPNRAVRAKLNRLGLELVGDISWPEHVSIFTTPFRMATDLGIPLLFYGENPQEAYGGPVGTDENKQMTRRWVSEFGGFLGLRPSDLVGQEGITERDMTDYLPKSGDAVAYFLGQFFEWDSYRNAKVAAEAGMVQMLPCKANWWPAENLDNAMTGLHDHMMYRKYGYGRLCAQISVDIRRGFISRETALMHVHQRDGLFPETYMDVPVDEILSHLWIPREKLFETMERFTNWELFSGQSSGRPILRC